MENSTDVATCPEIVTWDQSAPSKPKWLVIEVPATGQRKPCSNCGRMHFQGERRLHKLENNNNYVLVATTKVNRSQRRKEEQDCKRLIVKINKIMNP